MVVVVLLPFLSILISFLFVFSSDREMVRLNRSAFLDATNFASKESFANCVRNATTMASESTEENMSEPARSRPSSVSAQHHLLVLPQPPCREARPAAVKTTRA